MSRYIVHSVCSQVCIVRYSLSPYAGLHTVFFMRGEGGGNISAASRESGGMLPQKIFCNIGL